MVVRYAASVSTREGAVSKYLQHVRPMRPGHQGKRDGVQPGDHRVARRPSPVTRRVTVAVSRSRTRGWLLAFFERGDARRIPVALAPRIRRILSDLDAAVQPGDLQLPGYRLHPLTGDRRGQWSVRVSGNWRIVFRFEDGVAVDVTLIDYH